MASKIVYESPRFDAAQPAAGGRRLPALRHLALGRMAQARRGRAVPQGLVPHYVEARFRELVRDPERELKGLRRYCRSRGIRSCSTIASEERARIHANLTRAPDTDWLDVWRREMTAAERRLLEDAAGPLVHALGYAA